MAEEENSTWERKFNMVMLIIAGVIMFGMFLLFAAKGFSG